VTPEEIQYATDYIENKEDDLEKLTLHEMKMFLTGHFGRDHIESQGWKIRSNGYRTWWEKICKNRGPIHVFPHWVREMTHDAAIGGKLEIVNHQRAIAGMKPLSFEKYKKGGAS